MAKGRRKKKPQGKKQATGATKLGMTPERKARNGTRSMGMATRVTPEIDRLHELWKAGEDKGLPPSERKGLDRHRWEMLSYYRDQASLAEKSPVRSCCDDTPRGGHGPGVAIVSAQIETGRIERDLGELQPLARAVAVYDMSLPQWCIEKFGSRERRSKRGDVTAIVPINERRHLRLAQMELRMAADRITRGLGR